MNRLTVLVLDWTLFVGPWLKKNSFKWWFQTVLSYSIWKHLGKVNRFWLILVRDEYDEFVICFCLEEVSYMAMQAIQQVAHKMTSSSETWQLMTSQEAKWHIIAMCFPSFPMSSGICREWPASLPCAVFILNMCKFSDDPFYLWLISQPPLTYPLQKYGFYKAILRQTNGS